MSAGAGYPDDSVFGFLERDVDPLRYKDYRDDPHEAPGMLVRMIPDGVRVLDVGCGVGSTMNLIRKHRDVDVIGLEPQPERARLARDRNLEVYEQELTDTTVEQLGRFDVVLFVDVLEHLANPARALRLAKDILTPDGVVLASIPNVAHWSVRLDLLRGRFRYASDGIMDATHLRWFTEEGVRRLFGACGFDLMTMRVSTGAGVAAYKTTPPWCWLKKSQRRPIIRCAARYFPRLFGCQFVVATAPLPCAAGCEKAGSSPAF